MKCSKKRNRKIAGILMTCFIAVMVLLVVTAITLVLKDLPWGWSVTLVSAIALAYLMIALDTNSWWPGGPKVCKND